VFLKVPESPRKLFTFKIVDFINRKKTNSALFKIICLLVPQTTHSLTWYACIKHLSLPTSNHETLKFLPLQPAQMGLANISGIPGDQAKVDYG
jgi:hypothetical protein